VPEGKGQLARAYFKLAIIYDEQERTHDSSTCRNMAERLRAEMRPDLRNAPFKEEEFMKLCLWMLW
jgi:hypothetical protein